MNAKFGPINLEIHQIKVQELANRQTAHRPPQTGCLPQGTNSVQSQTPHVLESHDF